MNLIEELQAQLPEESVRYAFTGQTGINPMWRFLSLWLNLVNKTRVVAVTDRRIAVFSGHQLRGRRAKPKEFLYHLDRNTVIGPVKRGSWSKIQLGAERVWVARPTYPFIEKANNEIAGPGAVTSPPS